MRQEVQRKWQARVSRTTSQQNSLLTNSARIFQAAVGINHQRHQDWVAPSRILANKIYRSHVWAEGIKKVKY